MNPYQRYPKAEVSLFLQLRAEILDSSVKASIESSDFLRAVDCLASKLSEARRPEKNH